MFMDYKCEMGTIKWGLREYTLYPQYNLNAENPTQNLNGFIILIKTTMLYIAIKSHAKNIIISSIIIKFHIQSINGFNLLGTSFQSHARTHCFHGLTHGRFLYPTPGIYTLLGKFSKFSGSCADLSSDISQKKFKLKTNEHIRLATLYILSFLNFLLIRIA